MKAFAYLRCSGDGQIAGDTWERQEAAVLAYAAANCLTIDRTFRDEGISGKTELENRGGLALMTQLLREEHVTVVLVESADRLARDMLVSEVIIREFQKLGVTVISAAGGVDLTAGTDLNPTAKLIRQILAAIAEFDRCVTVNKLKAARDRKRAKGERVEGVKPYGSYPGERHTLSLMRRYSALGATCKELVDLLAAKGLNARSGKPWKPATVAKILARDRVAQKTQRATNSPA